MTVLFIFKLKLQMKNILFRSPFILFFMGAAFISMNTSAGDLPDSVPKGWHRSASSTPDIVMGTDTTIKHSGKASGFIQRAPSPVYGFGNMLQYIAADAYVNKRVRLTAFLKTEDAELAFLWVRVDGIVDGYDTAFTFASTQNESPMNEGPMQETSDWTRFDLTLDVLKNSYSIIIGAFLKGQGKLWMDDFTLEIVDQSVPSNDLITNGIFKMRRSSIKKDHRRLFPAINLDFEEIK